VTVGAGVNVNFNAVHGAGGSVWVAGQGGTVWRRKVPGASWENLSTGSSETHHDILVISADEAWVPGYGVLHHYTSAGGWSPETVTGASSELLYSQWLVGTTLWAVGGNGGIYRLTGGVWEKDPFTATGGVRKVRGNGASNVWFTAEGLVGRWNSLTWYSYLDSASRNYDGLWIHGTDTFVASTGGNLFRHDSMDTWYRSDFHVHTWFKGVAGTASGSQVWAAGGTGAECHVYRDAGYGLEIVPCSTPHDIRQIWVGNDATRPSERWRSFSLG
jgi:hypothetical protein